MKTCSDSVKFETENLEPLFYFRHTGGVLLFFDSDRDCS